ncbi:hypothetical protein H0H92_005868, partial [Tricholoma furcatifolium]
MFIFRALFALAAASIAVANPVVPRQTTNTNQAIHDIISALDMSIHQSLPTILLQQANHTATIDTLSVQITSLITAFESAATQLEATPVSVGSETVSPTNDEIGVILSDVI